MTTHPYPKTWAVAKDRAHLRHPGESLLRVLQSEWELEAAHA